MIALDLVCSGLLCKVCLGDRCSSAYASRVRVITTDEALALGPECVGGDGIYICKRFKPLYRLAPGDSYFKTTVKVKGIGDCGGGGVGVLLCVHGVNVGRRPRCSQRCGGIICMHGRCWVSLPLIVGGKRLALLVSGDWVPGVVPTLLLDREGFPSFPGVNVEPGHGGFTIVVYRDTGLEVVEGVPALRLSSGLREACNAGGRCVSFSSSAARLALLYAEAANEGVRVRVVARGAGGSLCFRCESPLEPLCLATCGSVSAGHGLVCMDSQALEVGSECVVTAWSTGRPTTYKLPWESIVELLVRHGVAVALELAELLEDIAPNTVNIG